MSEQKIYDKKKMKRRSFSNNQFIEMIHPTRISKAYIPAYIVYPYNYVVEKIYFRIRKYKGEPMVREL